MRKKSPMMTLALLAATLPMAAQQVEYATDEACGCETRYVDGIQTTQEGDLFGFRLKDGTQIVPNRYRYVDVFHGDYCIVYADEWHMGMVDRTGRELLPCRYSHIEYPTCGRILVQRDGLFGFADLRGAEVIEPQFPNASPFSEGLACIALPVGDSVNFVCTFIDTLGRQVLPAVYDNVGPFSEGLAPAYRYNGWGLIDRAGNTRLQHSFESISIPADGIFFAGQPGFYALFDTAMRRLTPFDIQAFGPLADGLVVVQRGGRWGALRADGTVAVPFRFDELSDFALGRARARVGRNFGIVDTAGREVLPLQYLDRTPHGDKYVYRDSLALVEAEGGFFFVDLEGNPLPGAPLFDDAYHFSQGLAAVRMDERWGYINTRGQWVIPPRFDIAAPFEWGRAEVYQGGQMHVIDPEGKLIR